VTPEHLCRIDGRHRGRVVDRRTRAEVAAELATMFEQRRRGGNLAAPRSSPAIVCASSDLAKETPSGGLVSAIAGVAVAAIHLGGLVAMSAGYQLAVAHYPAHPWQAR
jgi:hypothetical protein